MIKNIIFDVGNVLVQVRWNEVMKELGFEGKLLQKVSDATVYSATWSEYDRSSKCDEEILETFIANAPELENEIRLFMENEFKTIRRFDYALDWVRKFKEKGYHCYILSNYPRNTYEKTEHERAYEQFVDGAIYSYQVQMVKPEPEIYQTLLTRYGLVAEECIFMDDNIVNVQMARSLGIHAIQFTTKEQTEGELRTYGVKI